MSLDRQQKIEILARKNQAMHEHPYYITELSHILKQSVKESDLFNLQMTDNLFSRYIKGSQDNSEYFLKSVWPRTPDSHWLRICFCLAARLGVEEVALFAGPYAVCGAIRTKAEHPLVHASAILAFDHDTLRLQSLQSESGLYLDLYEDNAAWWVELKVWGLWIDSARECLETLKV